MSNHQNDQKAPAKMQEGDHAADWPVSSQVHKVEPPKKKQKKNEAPAPVRRDDDASGYESDDDYEVCDRLMLLQYIEKPMKSNAMKPTVQVVRRAIPSRDNAWQYLGYILSHDDATYLLPLDMLQSVNCYQMPDDKELFSPFPIKHTVSKIFESGYEEVTKKQADAMKSLFVDNTVNVEPAPETAYNFFSPEMILEERQKKN